MARVNFHEKNELENQFPAIFQPLNFSKKEKNLPQQKVGFFECTKYEQKKSLSDLIGEKSLEFFVPLTNSHDQRTPFNPHNSLHHSR
jgi:hypothetical protein